MPTLKYRSSLPRPDDPDIYGTIVTEITKGSPQAVAAWRAGIHEDTLYHWRYKGEAELAALEGRWVPWEELGSHAQLVIRIKEAQAGFVSEALDHWREAKINDWARWATLLERRDPENFGRRLDSNVTQRVLTLSVTVALGPEAERGLAELMLECAQQTLDTDTPTTPTCATGGVVLLTAGQGGDTAPLPPTTPAHDAQ